MFQAIMADLEKGEGGDVRTKERAIDALRTIGELTSELMEVEEDTDQKNLNDATTECASVLLLLPLSLPLPAPCSCTCRMTLVIRRPKSW